MRRRDWEKLLKQYVVPGLDGLDEPIGVHGGFLVLGTVGWTARVIWWSQASWGPRTIRVAAAVVEMPNGTPAQPMLWRELGEAIHSGGMHYFDIPAVDDDPEGEAATMGQVAGYIATQGIPYLQRYATLAAVQQGLGERGRELAKDRGLDYPTLEQSGYLLIAANEIKAGRKALEKADRQLKKYEDPPSPDGIRANIAAVLGELDRNGPEGVRRFLAVRAVAKAKDMHLPVPVFDPPVADGP